MKNYTGKFDAIKPTDIDHRLVRGILEQYFNPGEIKGFKPLAGGFANSNFLIQIHQEGNFVLKISHKVPGEFEKELSLLELVWGIVPAPKVLISNLSVSRPYCLMEFQDGLLLSECLDQLKPEDLWEVFLDLGRVLRDIHSFSFRGSGFFDGSLNFVKPFPDFGEAFIEYMESSLEKPTVRQRLGEELADRTRAFLEDQGKWIRDIDPQNRLVHADFNTKNIMVVERKGRWEVQAILDWEFAFSGSPLVDFGNFLRFEDEVDFPASSWLIEGYGPDSHVLSSQWKRISRILDLASMCGFLSFDEEKLRTFATARRVIAKTLDRFEE